MKKGTKIQINIGLITSAICAIGILILFIPSLFQHLFSTDAPHWPYMYVLLGLILPTWYGLALLRKKLIQTHIVLLIWCIGWLISFFLNCLPDVELQLYDPNGNVLFFLDMIVWFPTSGFLIIGIDISNIYEYQIVIRIINGLVVFTFLWIGVRGLKQKVAEENKQE